MTPLRMAVIGVGHLGKEHARILASLPEVELVGVADTNVEQAQMVARRCGTRAYRDYWPLLNLVDAATIVVPTTFHHAIATEFLRRGISLLVEKPLAATLDQADALVETARGQGAILQVGHIERFNPAFEELLRHPVRPKFIEAERLGPFTGRSTDIGAVLDLMIHDLDLLLALVGAPVCSVQALGVAVLGPHEDVANARLEFTNGCVATVNASRISAAPSRRLRVWSAEGYTGLDFARRHLTLIQPSEQLRLHRADATMVSPATAARSSGLFGHQFQVRHFDCNQGDQLTRELQHFIRCVRYEERPRVSGEEGRNAVALATRVLESLRGHRWEGQAAGPVGPAHLPAPMGELFRAAEGEAA